MKFFYLPTNHTNFRASECKTELVRVMPSAAENIEFSCKRVQSSLLKLPSVAENIEFSCKRAQSSLLKLPSVAENIELVKIRATEQVAILFIDKDS